MNDSDLKQLAEWVAEQLADGWQVDSTWTGYGVCLNKACVHTDGFLKLHFSINNKKRLEIGVMWGELRNYLKGDESIPDITVNGTKTPPQIARDIERRLLEHYSFRYRAALERKRAHEREIMNRWAMMRQLSAIIQGNVTHDDRSEYPEAWTYFGSHDRIEFKADYHGRVDVEIKSVPLDVARWIARIAWLKLIRQGETKEDDDERDQDTDLALRNTE